MYPFTLSFHFNQRPPSPFPTSRPHPTSRRGGGGGVGVVAEVLGLQELLSYKTREKIRESVKVPQE